jgi:hypothetical protein
MDFMILNPVEVDDLIDLLSVIGISRSSLQIACASLLPIVR